MGLVLWAISSMLTAGLFLGFAEDDGVKRGVLLGLAIGLEGAKILSWRRGGAYRVLAVSLICLSVLASLGAALETVQSFWKPAEATRSDQDQSDMANIDRQISLLVDHLATMQAERSGSGTMFDLIARAIGLPVETVMFFILPFIHIFNWVNLWEASPLQERRTLPAHPFQVDHSLAWTSTNPRLPAHQCIFSRSAKRTTACLAHLQPISGRFCHLHRPSGLPERGSIHGDASLRAAVHC